MLLFRGLDVFVKTVFILCICFIPCKVVLNENDDDLLVEDFKTAVNVVSTTSTTLLIGNESSSVAYLSTT